MTLSPRSNGMGISLDVAFLLSKPRGSPGGWLSRAVGLGAAAQCLGLPPRCKCLLVVDSSLRKDADGGRREGGGTEPVTGGRTLQAVRWGSDRGKRTCDAYISSVRGCSPLSTPRVPVLSPGLCIPQTFTECLPRARHRRRWG